MSAGACATRRMVRNDGIVSSILLPLNVRTRVTWEEKMTRPVVALSVVRRCGCIRQAVTPATRRQPFGRREGPEPEQGGHRRVLHAIDRPAQRRRIDDKEHEPSRRA